MKWEASCGDILDERADVLVCSANVFLNLSGGVGGAILLRYGNEMQEALHRFLRESEKNFVEQGDVVVMPACGLPYKAVLHAVAVDGFYQTSPQIVSQVVAKSLERAATLGAKRVALTALATGYGRMSISDFAESLAGVLKTEFPPIESVVVCVRGPSDYECLRTAISRSATLG